MKIFSKNILFNTNSHYQIHPGTIEIQNSLIVNIKKHSLRSYQEELLNENGKKTKQTHDFGDLLVTPSFVNCHTHIAMNFFRSIAHMKFNRNMISEIFFKAESLLTPDDVKAFARIGAYENLLNGNAMIWDHYYYGNKVAEACLEVGIGAVVCPTLQDLEGPGVKLKNSALADTLSINENKVFQKNGIFAAFGPHATDTVSIKLWKEIVAQAETANIPIHCHAAQTHDEYNKIKTKHNTTPIGLLNKVGVLNSSVPALLVHGIYLEEKDLKLLNLQKNALVFCPFSQMIFEFPANVMDWEVQKLKWFVATDCVASNDSMNLQKELRFVGGFPNLKKTFTDIKNNISSTSLNLKISSREKKLSEKFKNPSFLLNKILHEPGEFHTKFKTGKIEKGYLANLTIWNTSHPSFWPIKNCEKALAYGDTTGAIHNMCINGKWIGQSGNFSNYILNSSSYKNAIKEGNERLNSILKRLKLKL